MTNGKILKIAIGIIITLVVTVWAQNKYIVQKDIEKVDVARIELAGRFDTHVEDFVEWKKGRDYMKKEIENTRITCAVNKRMLELICSNLRIDFKNDATIKELNNREKENAR